MPYGSDPRLVRRLSQFAAAASLWSVGVGLSVLWGWAFRVPGLRSWLPGRITMRTTADLPRVQCDAALVRQVFQNLLANALKFTRTRSQAVVEVGMADHRGRSAFFVRDNGVGFDMKYAGKLFGVFQRLHQADEFEGTGVGLATVQRIIRKHGGEIWAEAALHQGATFYFTLAGQEQPERMVNSATGGA